MRNTSQTYYTIGLMSGSSLDGLDLAYCSFTHKKKWSFKLIHRKTAPLGIWEEDLKSAVNMDARALQKLSAKFATFLAQEVQIFITENYIKKIDALVSHGHTIYHYPEKGITCQIGDGQTLANELGLRVINNLRQSDMDLGGQGAPIVPIGDLYLFSNYLFCLNLGGIANISMKTIDGMIAFDVCTANQVLNHYANKLGLNYDDQGNIARNGIVNEDLVTILNKMDFYKRSFPKSLDNAMKNEIVELIDSVEINIENVLASYTEHIAIQIKNSVVALGEEFNILLSPNDKMLLSGGGAFNNFLIERIEAHLHITVCLATPDIINYKEAIIMAFIGVLKLRNEVNVLSSVTGACQDTSCGDIYEKI